jgi:TolB-like protein
MDMNKWMAVKKWMVLLLPILVVGCGYSPIYNGKTPYQGSRFMLMDNPKHTLDFFVESMTEELVTSNTAVSQRTPVAVASFVDLQDMGSASWLGNTVSESFIHQLQRRGFRIVDYKTTGSIKVTQHGDFALSRDLKELQDSHEVQYILTGTMLRQEGGVMVNARLVGMKSHVVVASAQGFLPSDRIGRDLDTMNSVRQQDGVLIRTDPKYTNPYTVVLRP